MDYKIIVLELIQYQPQLHEQLRKERRLLAAMECYAGELKDLHESWKQRLAETRPGSDPSQITSEALEIALQELQDCLDALSPPDESGPLSLEEAMAYLRKRTPPA